MVFISFCDLNADPKIDNVANSSGGAGLAGTRKIPWGAIWVGRRDESTNEPVLYMQKDNGLRNGASKCCGG